MQSGRISPRRLMRIDSKCQLCITDMNNAVLWLIECMQLSDCYKLYSKCMYLETEFEFESVN